MPDHSVNYNRYDRQSRTYGLDTVQKFNESNIYFLNQYYNSLNIEVIKNLSLSGIKQISFYNLNKDNIIYISLLKLINDLNPSIKVNIFNDYNEIIDNSICVLINQNLNSIKEDIELKEIYYKKKLKFVMGWDNNYSGCIFVDAGVNHKIITPSDYVYQDIQVSRIIENTIYVENHGYNEDDIISFNNLQGDCDILVDEKYKIFNVKKNSFQIDLLSEVKFINGFVKKVIEPVIISHSNIWEIEENNSEIIKNLTLESFEDENICILSIIGSIITSEIIKLITNKYTPINQWYEFYDEKLKDINIHNLNKDINIMMVGCGALGCEWLKNLANLGFKNVSVTDPDHIEISNLSRQYLFRNSDVKKSKSTVAVNHINEEYNFNYKDYQHKLGKENMEITKELFNNKKIIINALDNIIARKFIDNMCFENDLPLFESGTMGMKGNTQPIIPYLTETYNDTSDPSENNDFPVCTIKNFPNKIEHTIHWARDYFELFNRAFNNINKYIEDKKYLETLSEYDCNQAICDINLFCSNEIEDWTDCMVIAKKIYDKNYITDIKQLLYCYPKDHMINDQPFWSSGKRCPKVIDHYYYTFVIDFLEYTTKLLCNCFGIDNDFSRDDVYSMLLDFKIPEFIPNESKKIAKNDDELKNMKIDEDNIKLNDKLYFMEKYYPQEFEKDDDTNWHIKWITSASNCRAELYSIMTASEFETKGIAGKIIPAVATTTSLIVGLICIELLKYLSGLKSIEDYKSYFVNLSENNIIGFNPIEAQKKNINGKEYNQWMKLDYILKDENTIGEFLEYYNNIFNTNIETICFENSIIYSEIIGGDKSMNLKEAIKEHTNNINISLIIMDELENDLPNIKIRYD